MFFLGLFFSPVYLITSIILSLSASSSSFIIVGHFPVCVNYLFHFTNFISNSNFLRGFISHFISLYQFPTHYHFHLIFYVNCHHHHLLLLVLHYVLPHPTPVRVLPPFNTAAQHTYSSANAKPPAPLCSFTTMRLTLTHTNWRGVTSNTHTH